MHHYFCQLLISLFVMAGTLSVPVSSFISQSPCVANHRCSTTARFVGTQVSQKEVNRGIEKVVSSLRKDSSANQELGRLEKVNNILGYGAPEPDLLALRFNASFRKGGFGRSAIPLPFMIGQSTQAEGRGTMVGQVKATLNSKTGKIVSCSVFRDLGYGRAFNLKV